VLEVIAGAVVNQCLKKYSWILVGIGVYVKIVKSHKRKHLYVVGKWDVL
jgi:hypothetical protein